MSGGFVIACRGGGKARSCAFCTSPAAVLCDKQVSVLCKECNSTPDSWIHTRADHKLHHAFVKRTCDLALCLKHRKEIDGRDYCVKHAA